ncbi:MAG TPA: FAD-dependent oxidoreductase [Tepidisphaeraceae bacterium]|nr:FAD-dependent oxidoreductase [Tepidisphaeraceae bacterium]
MKRQHVHYLLLGGGVSAGEAAVAIRKFDRKNAAMIVTSESIRPYRRSELSRGYLRRELGREAVMTLEPDWFANEGVTLRTGRRATQIDVDRHLVSLDNDEQILFDRLLIATGAVAKHLTIPGANLPGVHYLRTLDDADRLLNTIESAKLQGHFHDLVDERAGRRLRGRAVVIGANMLGVEVASSLRQVGIHVELIARNANVWHRFAGESVGRLVGRTLSDAGIAVHENEIATRIEGDGRVQRVVLSSGKVVEADFIVACVGTDQNRDLLRGTPVAAERTILVDAQCHTSASNVWAAGDCCTVFDPHFGKHTPISRWEHAVFTGQIAGTNMAGGSATYDKIPANVTRWLGRTATGFGESRFVDHRIVRQVDSDRLIEFGVARDGRLAQILIIGDVDSMLPNAQQLVEKRVNVAGREDVLRDPNGSIE